MINRFDMIIRFDKKLGFFLLLKKFLSMLKARFDILFVLDCCLRGGVVEEGSILVCGFRWMRLPKKASVEDDGDLS